MCRTNLESRGFAFPPGFFQLMALRGELPPFVGQKVNKNKYTKKILYYNKLNPFEGRVAAVCRSIGTEY